MYLPTLRRAARAVPLLASLLAAGGAPTAAQALVAPHYSDLVFFGDSLSDTGNAQAAAALRGLAFPDPTQPYAGGRFSNGLLWTELLATGLGQAGDAAPLHLGGNNYAYAGARSGLGISSADDPFPGLLRQTQQMWGATHAAADPNALYVLVGGGNDMRDARDNMQSGNAAADTLVQNLAANLAAANLKSSLGLLAQRGAQNVLISNLPDLGNTPEAAALDRIDASRAASAAFNALLPSVMDYGRSVGLTMSFLDMAGVTAAVRLDTLTNSAAVYGVSNVFFPCAGFAGSNGAACSSSLFSDGLHPSARAHQIIANAAFDALGISPVPEPQTLAMMLAGLGVVGALARRRQAAGQPRQAA